MPNESRLQKRRRGYASNIRTFESIKAGQPLYAEKKALLDSMKILNANLIETGVPYDPAALATIRSFYADTIMKLDALSKATEARIRQLGGGKISKNPNSSQKKLIAELTQNNLLANTLAKDMQAFDKAIQKNETKSLHDIYESSRATSYAVKADSVKSSASGNMNQRIPLTIIDNDGHEVEGFFTPDKSYKAVESGKTLLDKTLAKYGSKASFLSNSSVREVLADICGKNKDAYALIISVHKSLGMNDWQESIKVLDPTNSTNLSRICTSKEKFQILLDCMHAYSAGNNAIGLLEEVKLNTFGRMNRRNSAMSKMAEILGTPDIIAKSENVKLNINGSNMKGTFMKKADGGDRGQVEKEPLFLRATPGSEENLKVKKQIADLQILDYLCGNPDRHGGNMLYNFKEMPDGTVVLDSIMGIDNDLSFGSSDFEKIGLSAVKLEDMKVITRSMADRVMSLTPDTLRQMFYGYELTGEEISNMEKRLKNLQTKIKKDNLAFGKGYGKGHVISGKLKVVEDDELEAMSVSQDLTSDKSENLFDRVVRAVSGDQNIESQKSQIRDEYKKTIYDMTVGEFPEIDKIYRGMDSDTVMLQGNQNLYNVMLDKISTLRDQLINFSGPVMDDKVSNKGKHTAKVKNLRQKINEALESVNNYIEYKDNKTEGEEWRNDPHLNDPGRKPGKTERRYKHALAAREFLQKELQGFVKLDNNIAKYKDFVGKMEDLYQKNDELCLKVSANNAQHNERRSENLYRTHMSRCEYEIYELQFEYLGAKIDGDKKKEFSDSTKMDIALGFAVNSLRPEDRPAFRDKVQKITGRELPSDEELLQKSIASLIVGRKLQMVKLKDEKKIGIDDKNRLLYLDDIKLDNPKTAVEDLMKTDEFKEFFTKHKTYIDGTLNPYKAGIGIPNENMVNNLIDYYGKATIKLHPERKKGIEDAIKKNIKDFQKANEVPLRKVKNVKKGKAPGKK